MRVTDFIEKSNVGKVKKRITIEDADKVSQCLDDITNEIYIDKMIKIARASEDIVDLLDVERISVDNMCRSFFIGFIMNDSGNVFPNEIKKSSNLLINTYIKDNYKTDCMDCISAMAQKKNNLGLSIDEIVEYSIKNLKVYSKEDLSILMMFLGIFTNRATRMGAFRAIDDRYAPLISKVTLN